MRPCSRRIMKVGLVFFATSFLILTPRAGAVEKAEVNIDLSAPRRSIDKRIYGQFIEHFGRIIQGGLWAELLRNRKFYPIDPDRTQAAQPWQTEADRSNVSYVIDRFDSLDGISSQRVSVFGASQSWRGIGQSGFNTVGGKEYTAYAWIKSDVPGRHVAFRLQSLKGDYETQAEVVIEGEGWHKYEVKLKPAQDLSPAVFRILFDSSGANWIGAASLMPSDNVFGMRKDVLELVKAMSPPIIRWPGGGYPDIYDWRNAIGPRDRRAPQPILPFGQPYGYDNGMDPNDFGTDEFLKFCELIGAEPYITANFGSGSPEMAGSWVEYTNGGAESKWGSRRASNGHTEPYTVKNWSVGNEVWGAPFETGNTTAEGYSYFLLPIVKAMRKSDPGIKITAVGASANITSSDPFWNKTVLAQAGNDVDFLSIHHYYPAGFRKPAFKTDPTGFYYAVVADPWMLESRLKDEISKTDQSVGAVGKINIAFDEWGEWDWDFDPPAESPDRSFLNQFIDMLNKTGLEFNHTDRDALFNARTLQMLMRLSDRIPVAARTHMINSLGTIRTDSTQSFLTASGVAMQLYRNHSGDKLVPLAQSSNTFDVPAEGWKQVPYLDATATSIGNKLFIHLINFHATEAMDVRIHLKGGNVQPNGKVWSIAPSDFMSRNDFGNPNVTIAQQAADSLGTDMVQHLPPHSIVTIEADSK